MTAGPQLFCKKPILVEAIQWDGTDECRSAINRWISGMWLMWNSFGDPVIVTREGNMLAEVTDWIVREPNPSADRRFYPVKPEIFDASYEPISDPPRTP